MKSENIVKKLQKEGYSITFKKWSYWDGVPQVQLDGFSFAIAEMKGETQISLNLDFIFNHVQHALHVAEKNNPIFLRKIKEEPENCYYMQQYLIRSMDDYYLYKNGACPYENYHNVLEKLKKEYD